mmetsp:Transcript_23709/g.51783  ORF Transcript_23709/g.51783 Transcript_23709/m.51783 type:complete len:253 (-) Transcript_23709:156-914(-)
MELRGSIGFYGRSARRTGPGFLSVTPGIHNRGSSQTVHTAAGRWAQMPVRRASPPPAGWEGHHVRVPPVEGLLPGTRGAPEGALHVRARQGGRRLHLPLDRRLLRQSDGLRGSDPRPQGDQTGYSAHAVHGVQHGPRGRGAAAAVVPVRAVAHTGAQRRAGPRHPPRHVARTRAPGNLGRHHYGGRGARAGVSPVGPKAHHGGGDALAGRGGHDGGVRFQQALPCHHALQRDSEGPADPQPHAEGAVGGEQR